MADARKTYAELVVQTDVEDTDLLASFRGSGPLKQIEASIVKDYVAAAILEKKLRNDIHILDIVPVDLWDDLQTPASSETDMTPYFDAAFALLPNGSIIRVNGTFLKIKTQLFVPSGWSIIGDLSTLDINADATTNHDLTLYAPQIITNQDMVPLDGAWPGAVQLLGGSVFGITFRPDGLGAAEYATKAAWLADRANYFDKFCIQYRQAGCSVEDCFFMGFDRGVSAVNILRPRVLNNRGHCNTLVHTETNVDWTEVQNNENWPFLSALYAWSDEEGFRNDGPAHIMKATCDWGQMLRPLTYGAEVGVQVEGSDNTSVIHFGIDADVSNPTFTAANPSQGLRYVGTIRRGSAVDGMVSSQTYGLTMDISAVESNIVHYTNVRVGTCYEYAHLWVNGNATLVNCDSYVNPSFGTQQTHVSIGSGFGDLTYIGHRFEDGTDVVGSSDDQERDVQVIGCQFVNMDVQNFFTTQLQGEVLIRGDDTTKSGKNKAALTIENRSAATGTATGQAYTIKVENDGHLGISDSSDAVEMVALSPGGAVTLRGVGNDPDTSGVILQRSRSGVNETLMRVNAAASITPPNFLLRGLSTSVLATYAEGAASQVDLQYYPKNGNFDVLGKCRLGANFANYIALTGAASSTVTIQTEGSGTAVGLNLAAQTSGSVFLSSGSEVVVRAAQSVAGAASLAVVGSSSSQVALSPEGGGTNVILALTGKGTGGINVLIAAANNDADAAAAGVSVNGLYRTSTGEVRIRLV